MTTGPINEVFDAVNDTYGCDFAVFVPTKANVARIRSKTTLDAQAESQRRRDKTALRTQIADPCHSALRHRAGEIHAL